MKKAKIVQEKPAFKREDFRYLDRIGIPFPQLVLGIKVHQSCFEPSEWRCAQYDFKKGRTWTKIVHQTAGIACHQHYMIGTVLQPKSVEVSRKMTDFEQLWYGKDTGCFGVSLDEIITYRNFLRTSLGVDCNSSYGDFEEAIFPFDCTKENLAKLTSETLPADLDDLIEWQDGFCRAIGCINRWNAWILTENSD